MNKRLFRSSWVLVERTVAPLRSPGFPVELDGVGELHAPFSTERRTLALSSAAWQEIRVRSGRDDKFIAPERLNCRSLGFPGFPVELGGFGKLHAPFLTERRTRGPVLCCVAGNPGSLLMTHRFSAAPNGARIIFGIDSQPFRAGLTFGSRPSGPCIHGDLRLVICPSTCSRRVMLL